MSSSEDESGIQTPKTEDAMWKFIAVREETIEKYRKVAIILKVYLGLLSLIDGHKMTALK